MFPSPSTSTPFSVKDILNLEQSHDIMVSSLDVSSRMDYCTVPTSSSSCMLARLKQEPLREMSSAAAAATASLFGEDPHESRSGRGNALNFATSFYGKSLIEMEMGKDGKSDTFERKRRKGESVRGHFILEACAKCWACRLTWFDLCKMLRVAPEQPGYGNKR